jgi:hypothetical protein
LAYQLFDAAGSVGANRAESRSAYGDIRASNLSYFRLRTYFEVRNSHAFEHSSAIFMYRVTESLPTT